MGIGEWGQDTSPNSEVNIPNHQIKKKKKKKKKNKKILIDNIKAANITKDDIVIGADESTMKKTIRTPKQFIFKNTKKNNEK